jgi:hypothetical protein
MKKQAFLFITFALGYVSTLQAQCTQTAGGFRNNSDIRYNITDGKIDVVLNALKTKLTLNLDSNFKTGPGPDVKVYLSNTSGTSDIKSFVPSTANSILFGNVSTNYSDPDRAHTFTVDIPNGRNISSYTTVFFYCAAASAFWDYGTIPSFSTCPTLSLDETSYESFQLGQNPVSDELTVSLDKFSNDLSLDIYNTLGALVYSKSSLTSSDNKIDVSHFDSGVYVARIKDNQNKTFVKRFIKR